MKILCKAFGPYQTNTYIISNQNKQIIIDPSYNVSSWVKQNAKNPIAILNTHGHSDHIWSNKELKDRYNIPIYCPKDDIFMLENDFDNEGYQTHKVDVAVKNNETFNLANLHVEFLHFPGHTPGSSIIKIDDVMFSGDFIFKSSIGRTDFSFGSSKDMKKSIQSFLQIKDDFVLYPGHGDVTSSHKEKHNLINILISFN